MNHVFLSFTFKSGGPTFLLFETTKGAQFYIDEGQNIAPDQIDSVIEALRAIKASIAKKGNQESNGEGNGEDEDKGNGEEAISSSLILPPFKFDTSEKLKALLGRKVKLRNGKIVDIKQVCVDMEHDLAKGAVIKHEYGWVHGDGRYWDDDTSNEDIIAVFPKGL